MPACTSAYFFFFFNDTATTEIYPLSLHDALPIWGRRAGQGQGRGVSDRLFAPLFRRHRARSEEHTSELQSHSDLVCRLLLEKKKKATVKLIIAHCANFTKTSRHRLSRSY